ncbi:heavy-metal-associated domain-containing protein [Allopusillimonas ginsengisoli]|nr:heavy-metal-associated domain-containing protein [Allopusillimonas ginsengisoli]
MKTSTIEVHDMLSVFGVDEVEKRIGEVPGVKSVTVNFAAGDATVRYDETRLDNADIKSAVRQRAYKSSPAGAASEDRLLKDYVAPDPSLAAASARSDPSSVQLPVAPAAPEGDAQKDKEASAKT